MYKIYNKAFYFCIAIFSSLYLFFSSTTYIHACTATGATSIIQVLDSCRPFSCGNGASKENFYTADTLYTYPDDSTCTESEYYYDSECSDVNTTYSCTLDCTSDTDCDTGATCASGESDAPTVCNTGNRGSGDYWCQTFNCGYACNTTNGICELNSPGEGVGDEQAVCQASCFAPPVCNNNNTQDNGETGVDCGGGGCAACPVCNDNGTQDNGETGVDCGGGGCQACPAACDLNQVTMNANPNPQDVNGSINFTVSGTQGSLWTVDTFTPNSISGTGCPPAANTGFWGTLNCTARTSGEWVHSWRNCYPGSNTTNINNCPQTCSKPTPYTVNPWVKQTCTGQTLTGCAILGHPTCSDTGNAATPSYPGWTSALGSQCTTTCAQSNPNNYACCIPKTSTCSTCGAEGPGACTDCNGGWCNGGVCETCAGLGTPVPTIPPLTLTPTPTGACVPFVTTAPACMSPRRAC